MEDNVHFSLTSSTIHTKNHAERVLLYALLLGEKVLGDQEASLTILSHAAIFHDTCRHDDGLDVGHGARAAVYYQKYCKEHTKLPFIKASALIMKYHDRNDEKGIDGIFKAMPEQAEHVHRLYRIFKDADALDRFRLGPNGFDARFIRNQEALQLVDFAKSLIAQSK